MDAPDAQLMEAIASDAAIDEAYAWLCQRRKDYAPDAAVWHLRWRWAERKPQIQAQLRAGTYRLGAVVAFQVEGENREVWAASDALVLKATAIVLTRHLDPHLSKQCYHLAGRGGAKAAVRAVADNLDGNTFVFRTDVKSYYASLDHDVLFGQLQRFVKDPRVLKLLWRYVHRLVYQDGRYREVHRGIPLGCPLSPLVGALYLKALDDRMAETGLFYGRFMDDSVILAPTRWKLRRAIRVVNQTLAALKLAQHPDKTFIGRTSRGFDFLGYTFSPWGLGVAAKTLERFAARVTRLYEQGAGATRIGAYVRYWRRWVESGLGAGKRDVEVLLQALRRDMQNWYPHERLEVGVKPMSLY